MRREAFRGPAHTREARVCAAFYRAAAAAARRPSIITSVVAMTAGIT